MAGGKSDPVAAQTRNAVASVFEAEIQKEPNAQRKAALGQAKSTAISQMNGMTGEEASAHLIAVILNMKQI